MTSPSEPSEEDITHLLDRGLYMCTKCGFAWSDENPPECMVCLLDWTRHRMETNLRFLRDDYTKLTGVFFDTRDKLKIAEKLEDDLRKENTSLKLQLSHLVGSKAGIVLPGGNIYAATNGAFSPDNFFSVDKAVAEYCGKKR